MPTVDATYDSGPRFTIDGPVRIPDSQGDERLAYRWSYRSRTSLPDVTYYLDRDLRIVASKQPCESGHACPAFRYDSGDGQLPYGVGRLIRMAHDDDYVASTSGERGDRLRWDGDAWVLTDYLNDDDRIRIVHHTNPWLPDDYRDGTAKLVSFTLGPRMALADDWP